MTQTIPLDQVMDMMLRRRSKLTITYSFYYTKKKFRRNSESYTITRKKTGEPVWYVKSNSWYLGALTPTHFYPAKDILFGDMVTRFKKFLNTLGGTVELIDLEVIYTEVCYWCGKDLTTPASIELGIGPDCLKSKGMVPEYIQREAKSFMFAGRDKPEV